MLLQLLGTTLCGIVASVPGLSQVTHSRPLCVSAAWDGFISSALASTDNRYFQNVAFKPSRQGRTKWILLVLL